MPTLEELNQMALAAREFLRDKNTTLWGRAFDISENQSLDDAAIWLTHQIAEFRQWLTDRQAVEADSEEVDPQATEGGSSSS